MQLLLTTFSFTPLIPCVLFSTALPSLQLHEYSTTPGWSVRSSAATPEKGLASLSTAAPLGAPSISQYPLYPSQAPSAPQLPLKPVRFCAWPSARLGDEAKSLIELGAAVRILPVGSAPWSFSR